jgi:hypothetical protein
VVITGVACLNECAHVDSLGFVQYHSHILRFRVLFNDDTRLLQLSLPLLLLLLLSIIALL